MSLISLYKRLSEIESGRLIPASELDWQDEITDALQPEEWPEGVLSEIEASVILVLSQLRTSSGVPFFPSPVAGAHVRAEGASQHSTQGGERLSRATDFYVHWHNADHVLEIARRHPAVGGLGIYDSLMLQGTPGDYCMFHIDTRPQRVPWVGHGREPIEYVLQANEPARYHRLIADMLEAHA